MPYTSFAKTIWRKTVYREPIVYADGKSDKVGCLVCGSALEVRLSKGRRSGKPFIMLICPVDGRHFRGFINNSEYLGKVLARLEKKA